MKVRPRLAAALAAVSLCASLTLAQRPAPGGENLLLGNPDNATNVSREHYLMVRRQYALSYNDKWRFPNWVGWHLEKRDIGDTDRGQFQPDPDLPSDFTRVVPSDYTRSGYDRGHNCPSKDRSASRQDNDIAFLMTNITPQQHGMNGGPWGGFEEYCRRLTGEGNEVYIYCGHGFTPGKPPKTIGRAKVAVPDFGWKVALVLPARGGDDLARVSQATRVIGVRMPNISTISKQDWRDFRVSVADIEQATGLKFFTALPQSTAEALKNKVDFDMSSPTLRRKGQPPSTPETPAVGQVWVNLKSGVYWLPGTQYYGKTKQGKYMSEADAIRAGYRKAGGQ
jgi:endonuclease G, mitochondrial